MWRLAILAACVAAAVSKDGLQLQVKPCVSAAIPEDSTDIVTISWDDQAGNCDYTITDASLKEVESGSATGQVRPSIKDVGRYLVKVVCDMGSEAMYFDATFTQAPAAGKLITATAFPSKTSAYVSFSSSQRAVQFTCQLDQGEDEECHSPWHSDGPLASGKHNLTINLSTEAAQGGTLEARESLVIPFVI